MICFDYQRMLATAAARPPGYVDAVMREGVRRGSEVCMSEESYRMLCLRFSASSPPAEIQPLSFPQALKEFAHELHRWRAAGYAISPKPLRLARQAICSTCEHWRPRKYVLLGACAICHCTTAKPYLHSSACPLHKW